MTNIGRTRFKKDHIPWNKGKTGIYSEEHLKNMSLVRLGKKLTPEHRMKISLANIGRQVSPETRKKISNANSGKKCSEETKNKLRIKNTGKKLSAKTKNKMSLSRMGRKFSVKTIEKIRKSNMGKRRSEEARKHISESNRKKANDPNILSKIRHARLKQIFPKKDTKPEKILQIALSLNGIKFEKHKAIIGQPDIFIEPNICIFVDGDYWHANPEKYSPDFIIVKKSYKKAKEIWAYDIEINHKLNELGYQVIRLWDHIIRKDANECAKNIMSLINQTLRGSSLPLKGNLVKGD